MSDNPVIDRSEAQKTARVEQLRAELAELGYAVIRKDQLRQWLQATERFWEAFK